MAQQEDPDATLISSGFDWPLYVTLKEASRTKWLFCKAKVAFSFVSVDCRITAKPVGETELFVPLLVPLLVLLLLLLPTSRQPCSSLSTPLSIVGCCGLQARAEDLLQVNPHAAITSYSEWRSKFSEGQHLGCTATSCLLQWLVAGLVPWTSALVTLEDLAQGT